MFQNIQNNIIVQQGVIDSKFDFSCNIEVVQKENDITLYYQRLVPLYQK